MKKDFFLRASLIALAIIILLIQTNCGGGGAASPGPNIPVDPTATSIPIAPTATPTTPGGITPVETPTFSTPVPTATSVGPSPTATTTSPTATPATLNIKVFDMYTGSAANGESVTYTGQIKTTDSNGNCQFNKNGSGTIIVNCHTPRTINYGGDSPNFEIGIIPNFLKTIFFWASNSQVGYHVDVIFKWIVNPIITICKQYDGTGGALSQADLDYLRYCANEPKKIIPEITIEEIDSKPEDLPGWNQLTTEFGIVNNGKIVFYMGNFTSSVSGQGACLVNNGDQTIRGAGAKVKKGSTSHQVGLHELVLHALKAAGETSQYPGIAGNYEYSVGNYPSTGFDSQELTEADKAILRCWWQLQKGTANPCNDPSGVIKKIAEIKTDNITIFKVDGCIVILNKDQF